MRVPHRRCGGPGCFSRPTLFFFPEDSVYSRKQFHSIMPLCFIKSIYITRLFYSTRLHSNARTQRVGHLAMAMAKAMAMAMAMAMTMAMTMARPFFLPTGADNP